MYSIMKSIRVDIRADARVNNIIRTDSLITLLTKFKQWAVSQGTCSYPSRTVDLAETLLWRVK